MAGKILVPRILWFALFLSTLIYLYVLDLTTVQGGPDWERLFTGLSIAALVAGVTSLFAPRLMLRRRPTKPGGGSS